MVKEKKGPTCALSSLSFFRVRFSPETFTTVTLLCTVQPKNLLISGLSFQEEGGSTKKKVERGRPPAHPCLPLGGSAFFLPLFSRESRGSERGTGKVLCVSIFWSPLPLLLLLLPPRDTEERRGRMGKGGLNFPPPPS